jgi:hypothetical protein
MKKFLLLFLVLCGGVCTVSAWGDLYLICSENATWSNTSYQDAFKFTCVAENQYRATVPGSYITSGSWYFRFRDSSSDTWMNISPESTSDNAEITGSTYSTNWQNNDKTAFYISQNEDAKYVHIYCNWNTSTSKWDITCAVVTATTDYHVAFTEKPVAWDEVYVYAFLDGVTLTAGWPGTKLSLDNGVYKATITGAANSRVIFNKGTSGDGNQSWTFDVADEAVYNYSSKIANQTVTVSKYGKSTFCSAYPLDFSTATPAGLTAYKITAANKTTGELTKEALTKVPAGVGVYLEGASGENATEYTVTPTATATSIGTDNMLVGVTANTDIAQTTGDKTNFILTVNTVGGDVPTPKFFKVNTTGNTVKANMAYLQIPTASLGARDFFSFADDTTTAIDAVKQEQKFDGQAYNLAGQRIAQPTKGLYIVNGKKVIIK